MARQFQLARLGPELVKVMPKHATQVHKHYQSNVRTESIEATRWDVISKMPSFQICPHCASRAKAVEKRTRACREMHHLQGIQGGGDKVLVDLSERLWEGDGMAELVGV